MYENEIEELRKEINRLNVEIIDKIKERTEVAVRIGKLKKKYGRPIIDKSREKKLSKQIQELAKNRDLNAENLQGIFREIIHLCTEVQKHIQD